MGCHLLGSRKYRSEPRTIVVWLMRLLPFRHAGQKEMSG